MICDFSLRHINKILFHFLFIFSFVFPIDTWAASAAESAAGKELPVVGTIVVQGRLSEVDAEKVRAAMPFERQMKDLFSKGKRQSVPYAFYSRLGDMHVTLAPMGKKDGSSFSGPDSEDLVEDLFYATAEHHPYAFSLGKPHFFVHLLTDEWVTLRQDDGPDMNLASLESLVGEGIDYGYFVLPLNNCEQVMAWNDFAWFEQSQNPFCIQRQTEFNPHITIAQVGVRNRGEPFIRWTKSNMKDIIDAFMGLKFSPEMCSNLSIDTLRLTAKGRGGAIIPLADRSLSGKGIRTYEENMYEIFGRPGERSKASAMATPTPTQMPPIPTPSVATSQQRVPPPVAPQPPAGARLAGNSQGRAAPGPVGHNSQGPRANGDAPYFMMTGNVFGPFDQKVRDFLLKKMSEK